MNEWLIVEYVDEYEEQWDSFVTKVSCNGTFLHTRKFLNYHGRDKFADCSIMFYYKGQLVALCPANEVYEDDKKVFISHQGSTYGGIIYESRLLRVELTEQILQVFESYLKSKNYNTCILKITPNILCDSTDDLFVFCFEKKGFNILKELNLYIDLDITSDDLTEKFSKLKKRQLAKCLQNNMICKEIFDKDDIAEFYDVLSENLLKYNKTPVHTVDELCDLKQRFVNNIHFYCVYYDNRMVAGTMVFEHHNVMCAHTQYLAARRLETNLSPMTLIYYYVLEHYKKKKYKSISWGIATDHLGYINYDLMRNKEEFGSRHLIHITLEKQM